MIAKILYCCRTVPPSIQASGLGQADRDIRHSLGQLVGSPLSDEDWRLASVGVANGGIGARSALEHAPTAYISSLAQSQELCARIWPGFDEYDIDGGLRSSETESDLISGILPSASIHGSSITPSQKSLSAKIEAKACCHLLDPSSQEHHRRAHFCLNRIPGAGVWLFALPGLPRVPHSCPLVSGQPSPSPSLTHLVPGHELHALWTNHGQMGRPRSGLRMRQRSGHSPQSGARRGSFCC